MHEAYTDKNGEDKKKTPEQYEASENASQQSEAMSFERETVRGG